MNRKTFAEFHERYRDRVLSGMTRYLGNTTEAEDATSAAFVKAYRLQETFRGESSLYTWVYAIALNEARARWQRKPVVSLDALVADSSFTLAEPDRCEANYERSECSIRIRETLRLIPAKYRRVLVKRYFRRRPVGRIAREEGVPLGTVLSRIFSAKRKLRRAMEAPYA